MGPSSFRSALAATFFACTGYLLSPERIWWQYQRSSDPLYFGTPNHVARSSGSLLHRVIDRLEAALEPHGTLVSVGRLLTPLLAGVPRMRVVDEHTPDLHYSMPYWLFRVVLMPWVVSAVGWLCLRERSARRTWHHFDLNALE